MVIKFIEAKKGGKVPFPPISFVDLKKYLNFNQNASNKHIK
jgi:hypothetical protein